VTFAVARYRQRFTDTWDAGTPVERLRFVSLDLETTGLDPVRDAIVTIGAVAISDGEILIGDSYSALLRVGHNTAAVAVHGVTRDQSLKGLDEALVVEGFLDYLADGVIVGHHIGHDITALNAACTRHWGLTLENRHLDTMDLTLHLEQAGAFVGRRPITRYTLDALCELFGVVPHDRHTASGDAFITAQVFQRLLRLASRYGRTTLERICEPFDVTQP
jgi:DNA polymerase-3 subunit epsilon